MFYDIGMQRRPKLGDLLNAQAKHALILYRQHNILSNLKVSHKNLINSIRMISLPLSATNSSLHENVAPGIAVNNSRLSQGFGA